jgi:hypothetical protein
MTSCWPSTKYCAIAGSSPWSACTKTVVAPHCSAMSCNDAATVIPWARKRIAGFKFPKTFDLIAEMPHNKPQGPATACAGGNRFALCQRHSAEDRLGIQ